MIVLWDITTFTLIKDCNSTKQGKNCAMCVRVSLCLYMWFPVCIGNFWCSFVEMCMWLHVCALAVNTCKQRGLQDFSLNQYIENHFAIHVIYTKHLRKWFGDQLFHLLSYITLEMLTDYPYSFAQYFPMMTFPFILFSQEGLEERAIQEHKATIKQHHYGLSQTCP